MDAIVKPAAKELGMECVRADQLPDPGQITTQIIDRIVGAKIVVAKDLAPNQARARGLANEWQHEVVRPT